MGKDHTMITESIYPFEKRILTNKNMKMDFFTKDLFSFLKICN